MTDDLSEPDILSQKMICHRCIGEKYLKAEIRTRGRVGACSYCGRRHRCCTIGELADRVEKAFEQHYRRTADQPTSWQYGLLSDPESDYSWYRDGEPATAAIAEATEVDENVADDIRTILADRNGDFDAYKMGEETEFDDSIHYEPIAPTDERWREDWQVFERSLITQARFFSRAAAAHLASVFEGIDKIVTTDGRSLVVAAGPETAISGVVRARVFQSDDRLKEALCRPDLHLGPPPSRLASAGRLNARGISVFYGATDADLAIAEVRPPVGSQVAVCRFEILRNLRLLDLAALRTATDAGSVFDPDWAGRLERITFLRFLSAHMTRPVMPDDEAFDYLATQAVADFLATENDPVLDGILFPSSQMSGPAANVILFHKSSRVEELSFPAGTTIEASLGQVGEDGWEPDYSVIELVPPERASPATGDMTGSRFRVAPDLVTENGDFRMPTLRVVHSSTEVQQILGVNFNKDGHNVSRRRWTKQEDDF